MTYMLCRNQVRDYETWKGVFDSHKEAHQKAGLQLERIWQDADNPNNVFFLFEVEDRKKAEAFISDPVSAKAGKDAGVIDGNYHFIEDTHTY